MKKALSILLIMLLVVSLGGCKLLEKKGTPAEGGASTKEESKTKEEGYSGNLEKIMGLGIPVKCEWKRDENYYGTSWIKGKNSAGTVYMKGQTNNVIFKDNCLWSWQENNPQGFKMCFEPEAEKGEIPEESPGPLDTEQMKPPTDIDYKCQPAVFGADKFNPPANVTFMTMEEMMKGEGNMMPQEEETTEEEE